MRVGTILNSKGWGIFGKLVRWRNQLRWPDMENWAHTCIITKIDGDTVEIAEALGKGFTITNYEKWWVEAKIKEGFYVEGNTITPIKNIRETAQLYQGRPYGFFDIMAIVGFWILGGYSKYVPRVFGGSKALICSEAIARILYDASNKQIDFEKEFNIPYDLIEPMHLWTSNQIKWK